MLFEILNEAAKVVGAVTGTILGVSAAIIAEALGITESMVREAKRQGCETYQDIRDFYNM